MQSQSRWRSWREGRRSLLPEEKRLSKEAGQSLLIHWCYQFGASMSGVFLNLYLWRLTEDLWINGMYNVILYGCMPFGFMLAGWVTKRWDRLVASRLGLFLVALFYLMIALSQENVVSFYMLFAVFNSLAASFYFSGYLVLMYDVSTNENRIRYFAINMIVFTSAGLAGPAVAGFIIAQSSGLLGYIIVFSFSFMMFVIAAIISFRIKLAPKRRKPYYLKLMGLLIRKEKAFRLSLVSYFVLGLFQGMMLFLPVIMLYQVIPREDYVGYLGVCFSGVSVATSYVLSRYAVEHRVRLYVTMSAIGFVLGASMLLWEINLVTIILFMVLFSIASPLQTNSISPYFYRLMGKLPLKGQLRVESVVIREAYINPGRVISILLLIIFVRDIQGHTLAWVLLATALLQFTMILLVPKAAEFQREKELAVGQETKPGK